MADKLIVVTAGGFGRELYDYAVSAGFDVRGFLHDLDRYPGSLDGLDIDHLVLGGLADHEVREDVVYAVGLGDVEPRRAVADELLARGARLATVVHPTAVVSPTATIGEGVVLGPFTFIGPHATIGDLTLVNTYASVAHDARTGRGAVLAPYAAMNGRSSLGDYGFVGTHGAITLRCAVGARAVIGAGAVALSDIPDDVLAVGVPARVKSR